MLCAHTHPSPQINSCMKNASPGSPDLVAMSFKSAFHGRLFGSLSLTRSKAIHKVGHSRDSLGHTEAPR